MKWRFAHFNDLAPHELHDIYQLRIAVFVIEQACVFQDIDGLDPECHHLIGRAGDTSAIEAYCRLVPPGVKFAEPSIGRVITAAAARGRGTGRSLMREAIARTEALWPGRPIRVAAQQYLERFYGGLGFARVTEPYDEDGIMHIDMVRESGQGKG